MSHNTKILVVEDSTFLTQIMLRQLASADHSPKAAASGAEAIEIMRDWLADIIIIDLFLPDMKGSDLVKLFRNQYPGTAIVLMSSSTRDQVDDILRNIEVKTFLQKPIVKDRLLEVVHYLATEKMESRGRSAVILPSPESQPYEIHIKSCYCCGFEEVRVFVPKNNAFEENWDQGLYPVYKPLGKFAEWDYLKTMISVCPLCLFASSDLNDFAEKNHHHEFPFRPEARKILSSGIMTRKKLIGLRGDERDYFAFDSPNRDQAQVVKTLQLAQKCGNAMILADKPGAHCNLGILYVLEQSLRDRPEPELLRAALGFFAGQIKTPLTPRSYISKSYYFSITCHFALNQSLKANECKDQLEAFYQKVDPGDALDEECLWNQRLVHIWRMGVDIKDRRIIDS